MKTVDIAVNEIVPYWNNPRKNDATVARLCKSIEDFGFNVPLVVNKDKVIITGHARLKAAKKLGLVKVPCVVLDISDEQAKKYRIADNKIQELTEWDEDLLMKELREIGDGIEVMNLGFSASDVLKYIPVQDAEDAVAEAVSDSVSDDVVVGVTRPSDSEEYVPKKFVEDKAKEVEKLQAELQKKEEELANRFPKDSYGTAQSEQIVICPHCGKEFKVRL